LHAQDTTGHSVSFGYSILVKSLERPLGEPDFTLGGLRLWIHRYEFPDIREGYDANWLYATVHCESASSSVWVVYEPMILTWELYDWLCEMERLYRDLRGTATLDCLEPYLFVELKAENQRGTIGMRVEICPVHPFDEVHTFHKQIDQSYLPSAIRQLRDILQRFPIRGRSRG
jgi:hypothetical protein